MYLRIAATILSLFMLIVPARAEVLATFYSHDFSGSYFPHAFIRLQGTLEKTGEVIDTNYGFTANSLSPGLLFGSVKHKMETKELEYIEKSKAHFTITLDDADYARLLDHVAAWRDIEGKGYNLGKRNCVHFVMEAAALYGVNVNRKSKNFKKPKSFLIELMSLNPELALIEPKEPPHIAAGEDTGSGKAAVPKTGSNAEQNLEAEMPPPAVEQDASSEKAAEAAVKAAEG